MNTTANGCPVRDPRFPTVWPGHMTPVNATLYALTLAWVLGGAALIVWFRNKPYVYERGFVLQLVIGVAVIFQATVIFLRDAIGRDIFPCDAYLWLNTLSAPLFAGSLWIRLFVFHFKGAFARQKQQVKLDDLRKEIPEIKPVAAVADRRKSFMPTDSNRKLLRSMNPVPVVSASISTARSAARKTNDNLVVSASDLARSKALAGDLFGAMVMMIILLPFLISISVQYGTQTYYGRGCVGCILGFTELWIFLGAIIAIFFLVVGTVVYLRMYRSPDPLWILRELVWTAVFAFVFTVTALVIDSQNPGRIHSSGIISWGYLTVFGISIGYTIQTYYAVFHSLQLERIRSRTSSASVSGTTVNTFEDVLTNSEARAAFEQHLLNEFSIENIKFYDEVCAWEKAYDTLDDAQRKTRSAQIYHAFIDEEKAELLINISAEQRSPLKELFSRPEAERDITKDVFAVAKREIFRLMSNDSFNRFRKKPVFAQLSRSVVAQASA